MNIKEKFNLEFKEKINKKFLKTVRNCHWGQTYTFDKMWISGGMIKSLLKIILGRPSCVKEKNHCIFH